MKITKRCGSQTVDALNGALLARAAEVKLMKTGKVRADTTVVEANVDPLPATYPKRSSWA